jgi:predicted tellurium resistance membrane protein TerC
MDLVLFTSPETWLAILTLTMLEIVLGIDNIIFITLLVNKLPETLRKKGRTIGLSFAMITRIGLLSTLSWMASLTNPVIFDFSGRDLILILGGGFLIYKSLSELMASNPEEKSSTPNSKKTQLFWLVMAQIAVIDIVFSLDSIITAVGLVNQIPIMICAVVLSVFIMMFALKPISDLLDKFPSFKVLALCFLVLVGSTLILEGFDIEIAKSYVYFCMGFAVVYEVFRLKSS